MSQTIHIETGQNITDICLQVYGSLDMLYALCNENRILITEFVKPGTTLKIPNADYINEFVTEVMAVMKPATDGTSINLPDGIGYMGIEVDFTVN